MRRDSRHERGAAIVSVLVLVSIATLLVASLFWRQHLATRSVQNRFASAQLRWIETAVLDWAAVANSHPEWMWPNDVHYQPAGKQAWIEFVMASL